MKTASQVLWDHINQSAESTRQDATEAFCDAILSIFQDDGQGGNGSVVDALEICLNRLSTESQVQQIVESWKEDEE